MEKKILDFVIKITESQSLINITLTQNLDNAGFFSFRIDYLNSQILDLIGNYQFKLVNVKANKIKSTLDVTLNVKIYE